MNNYYFTYGSDDNYPFHGGWTRITTDTIGRACAIFKAIHPCKTDGLLNCAFYYKEDEFKSTDMYSDGNLGAYEHEHITVIVEHPNKN